MILENGYLKKNVVQQGDCLELMKFIPGGSIDAVICDPPYGTTACKWDAVIPLEPMWAQLKRVIKKNGAIALFGSQPFTSALVMSNPKMFKYRWVWEKTRPGGFTSCKLKPLKNTEEICVFSLGNNANGSVNNVAYYPQGVLPGIKWSRPKKYQGSDGINYNRPSHKIDRTLDGSNYPREIISFSNPNKVIFHPTQKPVALIEYLIKTYTLEGETVLDFTAGSFTTAVACENLKRNWICIEKEAEYCEVGTKRINENRKRIKTLGKVLTFDL